MADPALHPSAWSRLAGGARQSWLDALRFRARRADYYEYLADVVEGTQGRKSLRDIFEDDARRYGPDTVRGRLCQHWATAYLDAGGDLGVAWSATLPSSECQLLSCVQEEGGDLAAALRDLARAARLASDAGTALVSASMAGVVAAIVAFALLCSIPFFSVPRLQQVFQAVPPEDYAPLTRALFALAEGLRQWLALWVVLVFGSVLLSLWSLANLTGDLRAVLDRWLIWRLYRDFQAIRFLSLLAVLIRQHGAADTRLRRALSVQTRDAHPWLHAHLQAMLNRIDAGASGPEIFSTGLLDPETWWYMADMMDALGVEAGLARVRQRVELRLLSRVRRQSLVLRWSLLVSSLATVLGITLWHYAVIDELRQALTNFYASQ
ncbi:general secretion pathway protein [Achromobacter deleyi]|uniref:general secretion pathway protein n=1 Tax=Achromobacter deleyi TaxID=1353891 RepID=UPI0014929C15|nr:general secretion pathway protein [Achromobacter deleyi]QVQ29195.1 general secretion pathway protein [Achromobacter deleyi]UIP19315.1 general secretion pathway protein [Achromobacter deleyi]